VSVLAKSPSHELRTLSVGVWDNEPRREILGVQQK
jgi:hypothetical protein